MDEDKLTFYFRGWCAAEGILHKKELCQKLWDKVYSRVQKRNAELYEEYKKTMARSPNFYMRSYCNETDVHQICQAVIKDAEFKDAFENLLK